MVARVSVRTRGGHQLRTFLRRVKSGRVRERYLALVADGLRRELLPAMEADTPKVSGTLSESFGLRRSRRGLALTSSAPYALSVRFNQENRARIGAATVRELAHDKVKRIVPRVAARAARRAILEAR